MNISQPPWRLRFFLTNVQGLDHLDPAVKQFDFLDAPN
jgi:hypothetical protein